DLEKYVLDPAKRETDWGSAYPNLRHKKVDYNAMRLARTSINHSYQTASIQASSMNPFVEGIKWESAQIHGRTCELCMERHGRIFPKDDVPLDHPNGLCSMVPYIPKNLEEVAGELKGWLGGADNPVLDEWYRNYGGYFAGGSIKIPTTTKTTKVTKDNINEVLIKDVGFKEVEDSFNNISESLRVSNTQQLLELENKFGCINRSQGTISATSGGRDVRAYVRNRLDNPTQQNLSLSPNYYKDETWLIESTRKGIESNWYMPAKKEKLSVYTVTHEYGHILQNTLIEDKFIENGWSKKNTGEFIDTSKSTPKAMFKWYNNNINEVLTENYNEIISIAKEVNKDFKLDENISRYGKTNKAEFFAETFANSQLGEPNELGKAMNVWLERKGLIK
ncbi:MAG: hypothetical protein GX962_16650, partial [Epulopiscium sp.]|nr:hypothetical protein [Candidatus Epulonipiscium sp.]